MKRYLSLLTALMFCMLANAQIKMIRPATTPATGACCGFSGKVSASLPLSIQPSKENKMVFDVKTFDDAAAFNGVTYKAPSDGVYQFNSTVFIKADNATNYVQSFYFNLRAGTTSVSQLINVPVGAKKDEINFSGSVSGIFKLKQGEEVYVAITGLGTVSASTTGDATTFSGVKLY